MDMTPQTWPDWYDGRHINEVLFYQQFLEKHPMKCVRGQHGCDPFQWAAAANTLAA